MKIKILCAIATAAWPVYGANLQLKYAIVVSRHGVRSPTWDRERLNEYSAEPWPDWGVAPGELTPHGRAQIKLMGAFYRAWFLREKLLSPEGCRDAARIYIRSDAEQRTRETGRAFAESLMPGCAIVPVFPPAGKDPLFSGAGQADAALARQTVLDRVGPDPGNLISEHRAAFDLLQFILTGGSAALRLLTAPAPQTGGGMTDAPAPQELVTASTLSENLLLEYTGGMRGGDLGWGRLTKERLFQVLELHTLYADLMRRTPYLARTRGSNLLARILSSLDQAVSGKPAPGALGRPGDALLVLAGHDTNLSNLSGILRLSWNVPGYQPDDAPPASALVFSLWQDRLTGSFFVRIEFIAASPDQIRDLEPLTLDAPPLRQELSIPGCANGGPGRSCGWTAFQTVLRNAIEPRFTELPSQVNGARDAGNPWVPR